VVSGFLKRFRQTTRAELLEELNWHRNLTGKCSKWVFEKTQKQERQKIAQLKGHLMPTTPAIERRRTCQARIEQETKPSPAEDKKNLSDNLKQHKDKT